MKEIIVIKQDWLVKDMKAGVPELDKLFICQKVEQVPETWGELKEKALGYPKRKNGIYIILKHYLDNKQEFLSIRRGKYEICQITHNRIRFWSLDMAIDIQHSWLIVKGIMEE